MSYRIRESGETVILSVLIGADQSLIGLKVKNSKIISIKFGELDNIVHETYGIAEKNRFLNSVLDHYRTPRVPGRVLNLSDCDLVVLETVCESPSDYFATDMVLRALKLYNGADIYSCYSINYRFENGRICYGGLGETVKYRHAIGFIEPHYALTEEKKTTFPEWYSTVFIKTFQTDCNESYRAMVNRYDISYMIGICEAEYVMLFTILETLFGNDLTKITSNIAKGTSKLLGVSSKDKGNIRNQMYRLYDVRSRYVHDGNNVPQESLFELREIVRRVLVEICNRGYHTKDKDWNELRDILLPVASQTAEETEKDE